MASSCSSQGQSSTSINSASSIVEDETKPLWKYVTKIHKLGDGDGNFYWQCNKKKALIHELEFICCDDAIEV